MLYGYTSWVVSLMFLCGNCEGLVVSEYGFGLGAGHRGRMPLSSSSQDAIYNCWHGWDMGRSCSVCTSRIHKNTLNCVASARTSALGDYSIYYCGRSESKDGPGPT